MSATKSKASKVTSVLVIILSLVFVSVIGVTAFSITNVVSVVEANAPASKSGIPKDWNNYEQKTSVGSEISSRIVNDEYVQYTTSLKNNSNTESLSITHFASYIDGNRNDGFIPLSYNSLEYTYDSDNADSWTPIDISSPDNGNDGFKFNHNIYVGISGSYTDTVYLRYNVDMSANDGLVDDVVAYIVETKDGNVSVATNSTTTEYNPLDATISTAEEDLALAKGLGLTQDSATSAIDESGEYVKPLGVSSEFPSANIISLSHLGAISISKDTLTTSIIVIFAAVGVFIVGLAAYLIFRHHASAKKH
jgi:hypothetical protein